MIGVQHKGLILTPATPPVTSLFQSRLNGNLSAQLKQRPRIRRTREPRPSTLNLRHKHPRHPPVFHRDPFRTHSGVIPGSFRCHSGPVPGSFRGHCGVIPGLFRDHSGPILGSFRTHSGVIPDPIPGHSGPISGPFRTHSGVIRGHSGVAPSASRGISSATDGSAAAPLLRPRPGQSADSGRHAVPQN